jgi:hypothetical protein
MSDNSRAIVRIRDAALTDVDGLAELFDSPTITDDGTPAGRLRAILEAKEFPFIPGLQLWIRFGDTGFRRVFQDPWPSSADQVGHFLTAVGLSFDPAKVSQSIAGRRMRDWLGAPSALTDIEVAMRVCIGHEKAPDPHPTSAWTVVGAIGLGPAGVAGMTLWSFRNQYAAATDLDVEIFKNAGAVLGAATPLRLRAAAATLRGIAVDSSLRGNSYQDLLLTLCGWRLGQMIRNGRFQAAAGIAGWIRANISV